MVPYQDWHNSYRGHKAPNPHRVFISGQKRGVFGIIKRELRRRSAIEAVIGHMKPDGHLGRCYLRFILLTICRAPTVTPAEVVADSGEDDVSGVALAALELGW